MLAEERGRAEFDVEAMKVVWAGSKHSFEVSDRMSRLVASDPVLESDMMMKQFQEVAVQLEQALGGIFLENFDISDEVREQIELVHSQFKRANERVDTPDDELYSDLLSIYNKNNNVHPDPAF